MLVARCPRALSCFKILDRVGAGHAAGHLSPDRRGSPASLRREHSKNRSSNKRYCVAATLFSSQP
ncbi:MAG: hypothetical protein QOI12_2553 [Alphaproteobacteria bacterium]|jgi:hypothetical protein|nr:hypothetical protein [Alphaproteobacteria bacterium]